MIDLLWLVLAFFLVLLNAFFVAAEFGMVKLRHSRVATIRSIYGFRGRILSSVHQNLDAYLSACQLGITLASLGLGWVGEPAVAHLLKPFFIFIGVSDGYIHLLSFLIGFSILSFLHIVIGELMPKSLAIRQSELVSVWTAFPLYVFYWTMYPAIWVLNSCSNLLLRLFGLTNTHHGENYYSTEEIKFVLHSSHLYGELTKDEAEILQHTMDLADLRVTEVMRPREEMVMLNLADKPEDMMETVMLHRYSRYPVYDPEKQQMIGIVHAKDLLSTLYSKGKIEEITSLVRPVLKVSHRLLALNLLREFRLRMPHFALIYSGKKTLIGFVTLDNLLHVMIGRIKDEFHRTEEDWVLNEDGSLSVNGDCALYSLEQILNCEIDTGEEDIDTLSGLIFYRLSDIPSEGQTIEFEEFNIKIIKMQSARILEAILYPKAR